MTRSFTSIGKRIRHIYYLKENIPLTNYLSDLQESGIKPVRFLRHLGILIGESEYAYARQQSDLLYSEPDLRVTITEPLYQAVMTKEMTIPWGIRRISAPKAWNFSRGRGIRVAVIDTGISGHHPALQRNYKGGINILSPYFAPEDYNGHGTHVAGIIAGRSMESGVVGVAPRASVYAVKAFNRQGSANLSDLLTAINWCIANRMHVVNMSFGMEKVSEALRKAIQIAHQNGVVMVAATGNQGKQMRIDYPACYPETIGVGSISANGRLSKFTNVGKGIDILAPGEKILSSWLTGSTREMSGTSMAVPHVSGTIALLLHYYRGLNPEQIRYLLLRSAYQVDDLVGKGVVNAYRAIQKSQKAMTS